MQRIKRFGWLAAIILAIGILGGCMTVPPGGGDPVYDATKTEQVKAAIQPLVVSGVRRAISSHTNAIPYVQSIATTFAVARDSSAWDPYVVALALDAQFGALPMDKEWAQIVLDLKNAVFALYQIFYAERFQAELDPEKWGWHVTDIIANSLEQALKEAQATGAP